MNSSSGRDSVLNGGIKEIRFRHWPLRQEPWRSLALLLLGAATAVLAARAVGSIWVGIGAWLALMICFWRMWLPVDFEFGPRGVVQSCLGRQRRVAWRDVARCEFQRRGLLLYATEDATAIGLMRSIYVHYPPQREPLRELIEYEMTRASLRNVSSSIETSKRKLMLDSDEPPATEHYVP